MISVFLIGFIVSFIGSLPIGMLNITVIQISVTQNLKQAILFSAGVSVVEFIQAFIAVRFSHLITNNPEIEIFIKLMVIPILIILGVVYFRKKNKNISNREVKSNPLSGLSKGMLLSAVNLVSIPFWVFYSVWFNSMNWITFENIAVLLFVSGASIGTFFCLSLFGKAGQLIFSKMQLLSNYVNKIVGGVFVLLGIVQSIDILMNNFH